MQTTLRSRTSQVITMDMTVLIRKGGKRKKILKQKGPDQEGDQMPWTRGIPAGLEPVEVDVPEVAGRVVLAAVVVVGVDSFSDAAAVVCGPGVDVVVDPGGGKDAYKPDNVLSRFAGCSVLFDSAFSALGCGKSPYNENGMTNNWVSSK